MYVDEFVIRYCLSNESRRPYAICSAIKQEVFHHLCLKEVYQCIVKYCYYYYDVNLSMPS